MAATFTIPTASGEVCVAVSEREDGDFNLDRRGSAAVIATCRRFIDLPWTLVLEQNGTDVVEVGEPGEHFGRPGDVIATSGAAAVVGVWAADCAPVALVGESGRIVVAHAGWRGLAGGIVEVARATLGDEAPVAAVVGPSIGPCCYEFGLDDLARVAQGIGVGIAEIASTDRRGRPALDIGRALDVALRASGVSADRIIVDGRCTGCSAELFSYRRHRDSGRHVMAVWRHVDD